MKRYLYLALAVAGLFASAGFQFASAAHDNSHEKNAFTPDTIPVGPFAVVRPRERSSPCWKESTSASYRRFHHPLEDARWFSHLALIGTRTARTSRSFFRRSSRIGNG